MVDSIGSDTIATIATAGPEMQVRKEKKIEKEGETGKERQIADVQVLLFCLQVKMLQALGLKSTLITDGSSPINLFNTAHGLLGGIQGPQAVDSASSC